MVVFYNTPHFFALFEFLSFFSGFLGDVEDWTKIPGGEIWGIPGALGRNYYWCIGVNSVNMISPIQRITRAYIRNYEVIPQTLYKYSAWLVNYYTSECTTRALNTLTQELHPWQVAYIHKGRLALVQY